MSTFPTTVFAGQRFAVVGLGKNGLPAARALLAMGAAVVAWDDTPTARDAASGLTIQDPREAGGRFDAIVLSPGIPHIRPKPHPIAVWAREAGIPILSDADLLFQAVRKAGSRARFVGITGTNGKSTTTALLAHVLTQAGVQAEAGANLGPAALSLPLLPDAGVYVLEMSSYMLERLAFLRFDVAAMLNLSVDHLDRHGDMAGYGMAKRAVFDRQLAGDLAVIGIDDPLSREMAGWLRAQPAHVAAISGEPRAPEVLTSPPPLEGGGREEGLIPANPAAPPLPPPPSLKGRERTELHPARDPSEPTAWYDGAMLRDAAGPIMAMAEAPALPGAHNAQNAAAVFAMARHLGLSRDAIVSGLRTYPGLPHRQQLVGRVDGIAFINDSKATNSDAAQRALVCYDRLIWIAGGMAKEDGIEPLVPLFPRIAHAFLIGRDTPILAATLAAHGVALTEAGTLEAAVPLAAAAARAADAPVVLLSPACASWDQFTGYDQRGDRFAELVRTLEGER